MKVKTDWTAEQWAAITEKDCSLLVAAAAGAGKTAVLVERIIRKITDPDQPVDIDSLLIMTFTNAAAAEMRERIAEAIAAVIEKSPGSKNLQRQLTLLNKASITTIHSFCLEVVRSNFQALNIDPGFRITDETEAALMRLEVLQDLFEDQYDQEENQYFSHLLECYGGNRDDQALQDMVLNLYSFVRSSPWPGEWLTEMVERLNAPEGADFADTPWGPVLIDSVRLEIEDLRESMARAAGILKNASGLEKYQAIFQGDLANLSDLLKSCTAESGAKWDTLYESLQGLTFSRLPAAGRDADQEKQDQVKKIRDEVKDRIKRIKEKIITAGSAELLNDLQAMHPLMKCLARLVSEFGRRYAARKSQKSVLDFSDLEHFCLEILAQRDEHGGIRPTGAALGYRDRYAEILVDEYQDSNLIQEMIISLVSRADSRKPNVFMVGDVKQSIYRFRQARPELFLEKYRSYSPEKGQPYRKILLFKNFRSRKEILQAVNFIFQQIMSVGVGELDYTVTEALHPGAVFPENDQYTATGGEVELHLIQTGGGGEVISGEDPAGEEQEDGTEQPDDEEMLDSIQCEARLVARRIRELMQPDVQGREFYLFDKGSKTYRKADYRDIVILLRTMRNWSGVFLEELAGQGIPAFADTGAGFFKTSEVQVVLSLLQIIDNPLQDIPLLAVIRSPIVYFTTEELAELRLADRRAPLYNALQALARDGQSPAAKKAATFLNDLRRWREISLYLSTDQLIWRLYNETGYYGTVGAMPAGDQRQANLRILFERARQFEETSYKGLFNFINFVDRLKSSKGDLGSAKVLGENDNVVRVMSIHKSKGLEFPVVFLAGCGKKFNLQDMNKSILLHQELGLGPDVVDPGRRLAYPSAPKLAIREKLKAETLSEEMRILYVAMTRAREKLIITGSVNDLPKASAKWARCAAVPEGKLPAQEMLKGGRYLDWLGPALLRHKDCGALRESAGVGSRFGDLLLEDPSLWKVRLWDKSDVLSGKSAKVQEESRFLRWLDELDTTGEAGEIPDEIARRLSWEYPYQKTTRVPAKVSVTELKRRFDAGLADEAGAFPDPLPALVKKPLFLEGKKGLSPAEAGTILHFVMQHLNYKQDIQPQIAEMVVRDLITDQQAQSVDPDKIRRFLESPLGLRLLASDRVHREVPFNIEIPCHELFREMQDPAHRGETLLLQGVIDCYFEEPDGIVLLDYKTDYAPVGQAEAIRERYRLQITYYARALEMLTGKKVKEKYIYLFRSGEALGF